MSDNDPGSINDGRDKDEDLGTRPAGGQFAEAIDICNLCTPELVSSGDLHDGDAASSQYARLLDMLPIPVLLIDQAYSVAFTNQSWSRFAIDHQSIHGAPFCTLIATATEGGASRPLIDKTHSVLKRAFSSNRSMVVEAILGIEKRKMWARIHLQVVRVGDERYLLAAVEDVTFEKGQLVLNKRCLRDLEKARSSLEKQVLQSNTELNKIREAFLLEIVDREGAEADARNTRERYRQMFMGHGAVKLLIDPLTGDIVDANPAALDFYGFDFDQIKRLKIGDIHRPGSDVAWKHWSNGGKEEKKFFECRHRLASGETRHVEVRSAPIEINGRTLQYAIIHDITERKDAQDARRRSEEKYRLLIEKAPVGILFMDREGKILEVNRKLLGVLGSPSAEATKAVNALTFPLLVEAGVSEVFRRCMEDGRDIDTELPYTSKWGKQSHFRIVVTPILSREGELSGCQAVIEDISEKKKHDELLLRTERLKAAQDMALGVVHNFNNLLQLIASEAETAVCHLESGQLPEALKGLGGILRNAYMGGQTVKRLRSFTGITDENTSGELEVFDLSKVVNEAIEISRPWWKSAPEKLGIGISLLRTFEQGCLVWGRKNDILDVSVNLIKNAAEALPKGGRIEVNTFVRENRVVLEVKDNGVGIAQDNLDKVFEPFWTTKGGHGTGVGLSCSLGIARQHQGEMFVESVEDNGAAFTLVLPCAEGISVQEQPLPNEQTDTKLRWLLTDDVEDFLRAMKCSLTKAGHSVWTALSGEEALEILKQHEIDVVVCDLGMPGMNGLQVGQAINELCKEQGKPKTPFILLSGWGDQRFEGEALDTAGVDKILQKPVMVSQLLQVAAQVAGDAQATT